MFICFQSSCAACGFAWWIDLRISSCSRTLELMKRAAVQRLRHLLERARRDAVCLLVGRHVFEAIAIEPILIETLIDPRQDRNPALVRAVVLRKNAIDNCIHRASFIRREEPNRLLLRDSFLDQLCESPRPSSASA